MFSMFSSHFRSDGELISLLALIFPNVDSYQQIYEMELFYIEHFIPLIAVYVLYM